MRHTFKKNLAIGESSCSTWSSALVVSCFWRYLSWPFLWGVIHLGPFLLPSLSSQSRRFCISPLFFFYPVELVENGRVLGFPGSNLAPVTYLLLDFGLVSEPERLLCKVGLVTDCLGLWGMEAVGV